MYDSTLKRIGSIVAIICGIFAVIGGIMAFLNWYADGKLIDTNQDNEIRTLSKSIVNLMDEVRTYTKDNKAEHTEIKRDLDDLKRGLMLLMQERRIASDRIPYQLNYNYLNEKKVASNE